MLCPVDPGWLDEFVLDVEGEPSPENPFFINKLFINKVINLSAKYNRQKHSSHHYSKSICKLQVKCSISLSYIFTYFRQKSIRKIEVYSLKALHSTCIQNIIRAGNSDLNKYSNKYAWIVISESITYKNFQFNINSWSKQQVSLRLFIEAEYIFMIEK